MPDCEQKHCPYCGHSLPTGTSFCLHCCKMARPNPPAVESKAVSRGAAPLRRGAASGGLCADGPACSGIAVRPPRRGRLTAPLRQPGSVRKQRVRQLDPAGGAAIPAVVFGLRSVCFAQSPSFRIWLRARFLVIDGLLRHDKSDRLLRRSRHQRVPAGTGN